MKLPIPNIWRVSNSQSEPVRHGRLGVGSWITALMGVLALASPLFGQANQPAGSGNYIFSESANNRRLELQMRLTF